MFLINSKLINLTNTIIPNLKFKKKSFCFAIKSYDTITTAGLINCSFVLVKTYMLVTGIFGILKQISSSHVYLL